jgi:magnesium and cobalt exporter, CNNM family
LAAPPICPAPQLSTPGELGILLALILFSGLLAGAEMAVVSVRGSRVEELVANGSRAARALRRLRSRPEPFLATVQVGINIVSVTAGAFSGSRFSGEIARRLAAWEPIAPYAESLAFGLVVALVTYLSLILGELVPKSLALRASERYALLAAPPLELLGKVLRPAVWILTASSNAVLRLFGDRTDFLETQISLEEVRHVVGEATEGGSVDPGAGEIAARALELGQLTAADVMVHRRFVVALPIDADRERVRQAFLEAGHRRVPVYRESIDDVVGYLSWRDVFQRVWAGVPFDVRELVRPAHFVPETMPAMDLLHEVLRERLHLAIAVDEHGGVAGIVTLEDLLEELVGEIESEHGRKTDRMRREVDGSALVAGETPLRDIDRELDLDLEQPAESTTLSGLLLELADGRIPRAGESFTARDGTRLEVREASPRRVRQVRVVPPPPKPPEE